jgi:hypothetical protein
VFFILILLNGILSIPLNFFLEEGMYLPNFIFLCDMYIWNGHVKGLGGL